MEGLIQRKIYSQEKKKVPVNRLVPLYYYLKPYIPRRMQIFFRRLSIRNKLPHVKDLWPINWTVPYSVPLAWKGWPQDKRFAFVLTHDVETQKGHDRCRQLMQIEKKLGFRSSYNFVPKRYRVSKQLREHLTSEGFEVGVHDYNHDGKLYKSKEVFDYRAEAINHYLKEWNVVGFRSGSMLSKLDWIHSINILYDMSTFDTDPFEPQPVGINTVFPLWISRNGGSDTGYVELPYTIAQDFTLFVLMRERSISIWKKKIAWIVKQGGMVLVNTHPDYICFEGKRMSFDEYSIERYEELLRYITQEYKNEYWHGLPRDIASFWMQNYVTGAQSQTL